MSCKSSPHTPISHSHYVERSERGRVLATFCATKDASCSGYGCALSVRNIPWASVPVRRTCGRRVREHTPPCELQRRWSSETGPKIFPRIRVGFFAMLHRIDRNLTQLPEEKNLRTNFCIGGILHCVARKGDSRVHMEYEHVHSKQ